LLDRISDKNEQLSEGEYFYKNLKLTVASSDAMGGEEESSHISIVVKT
jgi:hypothetical protein